MSGGIDFNWDDFDPAVLSGGSGSSGATSATSAVASAPPAPDATERRVQWSPDHSSFIDLNQYPSAIWRDAQEGGGSEGAPSTRAGWYTFTPGDTGSEGSTPGRYDYITNENGWTDAGPNNPNYWTLKDAGLWDLSDPNSDAWQYLQAKAGNVGDPLQDPTALWWALENAGAGNSIWAGRTPEGAAQYGNTLREMLGDIPPEYVDLFVPAAQQTLDNYWTVSKQAENQGLAKDIDDVAVVYRDMFTQTPLGAALMAYLGPVLAGAYGGGTGGMIASGATLGAGNAALQGGDLSAVLRGGAQGGLQAYGGGQLAGGTPTGAGGPDVMVADTNVGGGDFFPTSDTGMLPMSSMPGSVQFDANGVPISSKPAMTSLTPEGGVVPISTVPTVTLDPTLALPPLDPQMSDEDLAKLDLQNQQALEAGDTPPPAPADATSGPRWDKIAARIGATLVGMTGDDPQSDPQAPHRVEGQSDTEYAQQLVDYLGLDAQSMADQGLVPGSQEYYDYIMQQADTVIQQITEGMDVDADDISAQLRTKSDQELQQLQRALYVRGQLDLLVGSGQYVDPFTGQSQDISSPDGEQFNPSVAAFQRGRAADVQGLAGMLPQDAMGRLQELLGRNTDLFGMEKAARDRYEQAKLEDDLRRRRGMLSY